MRKSIKKFTLSLTLLILSNQILATNVHVNTKEIDNLKSHIFSIAYTIGTKFNEISESLDTFKDKSLKIENIAKFYEINIYTFTDTDHGLAECSGNTTIDGKTIIKDILVKVRLDEDDKLTCEITKLVA